MVTGRSRPVWRSERPGASRALLASRARSMAAPGPAATVATGITTGLVSEGRVSLLGLRRMVMVGAATSGKGGGAMLSVTSREAASHFFAECHDSLDAKAPDLGKLVAIGAKHQVALG